MKKFGQRISIARCKALRINFCFHNGKKRMRNARKKLRSDRWETFVFLDTNDFKWIELTWCARFSKRQNLHGFFSTALESGLIARISYHMKWRELLCKFWMLRSFQITDFNTSNSVTDMLRHFRWTHTGAAGGIYRRARCWWRTQKKLTEGTNSLWQVAVARYYNVKKFKS